MTVRKKERGNRERRERETLVDLLTNSKWNPCTLAGFIYLLVVWKILLVQIYLDYIHRHTEKFKLFILWNWRLGFKSCYMKLKIHNLRTPCLFEKRSLTPSIKKQVWQRDRTHLKMGYLWPMQAWTEDWILTTNWTKVTMEILLSTNCNIICTTCTAFPDGDIMSIETASQRAELFIYLDLFFLFSLQVVLTL